MSYLELDLNKTSVDASCRQAIISFWFWVGAYRGPGSPPVDPPPPPGSLELPSGDEIGVPPSKPSINTIAGVAPLLTFGDAALQNDQYYMKKYRRGYLLGPGITFVTPSPTPTVPDTYFPPPLTPADPPPIPTQDQIDSGAQSGPGGTVVVSFVPEKFSKGQLPQSYIGIAEGGRLSVLLQTADVPEICEGLDFSLASLRYNFFRNAIVIIAPASEGGSHGPFEGLGDTNAWGGNYEEYQDISFAWKNLEAISLGGGQACALDPGWHHVLLSFDLTSCAAKSTATSSGPQADNIAEWSLAWLALDDRNLVQSDLSETWVGWDNRTKPTPDNPDAQLVSLDDQGVVTRTCSGVPSQDPRRDAGISGIPNAPPRNTAPIRDVATVRPRRPDQIPELRPPDGLALWAFPLFLTLQEFKGEPIVTIPGLPPDRLPLFDDYPLPNYKCTFNTGIPLKSVLSSGGLQSAGSPLGIPASGIYSNRIAPHNMAELQIWFGQKLDLSDEKNRRLFIDVVRDKDGHPVVDANLGTKMAPVNMSIAEKALGRPHVQLHKTSRWKKGKNTGTLGDDDAKSATLSGQFVPHVDPSTKPTPNVIIKFKPDPFIWKK
jgi:hypothetical protein